MNKGKYVYSQVMTYFPRWVFEAAVDKYNGDFHTKNLNSYSYCLNLMFGQMAGCKSLKDITLVLKSIKKAAYHLGIPTVVDPSSLSKANEVRDYRIFAIDFATIPCSIKLAEWALGKYSKGGVKMHTVLDLCGSIPDTIYVTDSRYHNSNFLDVPAPLTQNQNVNELELNF